MPSGQLLDRLNRVHSDGDHHQKTDQLAIPFTFSLPIFDGLLSSNLAIVV